MSGLMMVVFEVQAEEWVLTGETVGGSWPGVQLGEGSLLQAIREK
jgi:hypothetical protein